MKTVGEYVKLACATYTGGRSFAETVEVVLQQALHEQRQAIADEVAKKHPRLARQIRTDGEALGVVSEKAEFV